MDNKEVVRRFVDEVINSGRLAVVDELLSDDYRYHAPGMEIEGRDGIKGIFTMLRTAFPDWREEVEDLIAEGDRVVFRVTGTGTHKEEFQGIAATGEEVRIAGIDIVRLEGGRIIEHWAMFDQLGMMRQLGAIPSP